MKAQLRRGRPPDTGTTKGDRLYIRLEPSEKAAYTDLAARRGSKSLSHHIRLLLQRDLEQDGSGARNK
jgi:hypothetical protein